MPLPTNAEQAWPPAHWAGIQADLDEASAWYSGDPAQLAAYYTNAAQRSPRTVRERAKFWLTGDNTDPQRQRLHLPVAADVASTAADLLFGETPSLSVPEAHLETADSAAIEAEDRLQELVEEDGIVSTLLEAGEIASGLSGVYLRPVWDDKDPDLPRRPILTTIHADRAIPEFRFGYLTAVTFWSVVLTEGSIVWRHLERHERGVILHGLYAGTKEKLGDRRDLKAIPQTAKLAGDQVPLPAGIEGLDVRYVPNIRPNRKHRGLPVGRHDTAGQEGLMDALDETWSSWMRDIRLGKLRVIVPDEFLSGTGARGGGRRFDVDQEIFSPLSMDPANMERAGITTVEFKLRVEEHAKTALDLYERIVSSSGYSPQSFGLQGEGGQMTATEVRAKQSKSLRTTGKKQRYWTGVEDVAEMLLIIDREVFGSKVEPFRPRLDFGDPVGSDIRDTASALNLINLAQAASVQTRVELLHPEWDAAEVTAEVERIKDELGIGEVVDPTGAGLFGASDEGAPVPPAEGVPA